MRSANGTLLGCATGVVAMMLTVGLEAGAQAPARPVAPPAPATTAELTPPADYVIGPDDVLSIVFWKDQDMTADVIVRPDGKITLPLLNDVHASGLTPEQLKVKVTEAASKFIEAPNVMVRVSKINSRNVTVVGEVAKQGPIMISGATNVLQLIGLAGGLLEFADGKNILIIRTEANGQQQTFKFNYNDVKKGKNLRQNIQLRPGDTVVVP